MAKRLKVNNVVAAKIRSANAAPYICEYSYAGLLPKVKQQICDMAINGSGIRDTARVLGVSRKTVIETFKEKSTVENS
jgi:hypothetical protein